MNHRDEATKTLCYYFKMVFKKSGIPWDPDFTAEIESAVDSIISQCNEDTDLRLKQNGLID